MYTTCKQYHIAIDVALQELNSNRKGTVEPEEKDIELNNAVIEFIETRSSGNNVKKQGFEESIKRYDDLQVLKKRVSIPPLNYNRGVYGILPVDYYKYIPSELEVTQSCVPINVTTNTITNRYCVVPVPTDSATTKYVAFKIVVNSSTPITLFDLASYTSFGTMYNQDSLFELIRLVLKHVNYNSTTTGYTIYWERYLDIYAAKSFIIVKGDATLINARLTFTGNAGTLTTPTIISYITNSYPSTIVRQYSPLDLISTSDIHERLKDHYATKNLYINPMGEVINDRLYIPTVNFYVTDIILDYIKKPTPFNYKLDWICELTNSQEIVSIAVKNIAGTLAKEDYQVLTNKLNTIE